MRSRTSSTLASANVVNSWAAGSAWAMRCRFDAVDSGGVVVLAFVRSTLNRGPRLLEEEDDDDTRGHTGGRRPGVRPGPISPRTAVSSFTDDGRLPRTSNILSISVEGR